MKKYITLIIAMFIMISAQAEGLGPVFDKAIRNGRSNYGKGSYFVQFDNKNVPVDDVLQFMQKRRYILTESYSTRRMLRFGSYTSAMGKVDFILESELESFIANTPYTSTMGKAVIYAYSTKEIIDVYWSGSVKNGWISGNGIGYTKLKNYSNSDKMFIIKGNFRDGIPEGNCEVVVATPKMNLSNGVRRLEKTDRNNTNYYVGSLNNGYRSLCMNGKYGFINEKGDLVASCKYGKIVQEFNNAGYAIVTDPSDSDQEIKINTYGTKLGYSDRQLQINEEKRLAKIAEEKRLAEEKKRKEEERRLAEERIQREREKALAEARAEEERQERFNAKKGNKSGNPTRGKVSSFVDLGLPSGTLWAKWNVGASYPEEVGDSFTWGETKKPKNGKDVEYTRLGQVLEERDDAATANWGKNWRTPTKEEWDELRRCCSFSWTDQGCYVVGPNGNSIFLPGGRYWSATYIPELSLGWNPYKTAYETHVICYGTRHYFEEKMGFISDPKCVRPVLKYTKDEYMMMSIENQLGN